MKTAVRFTQFDAIFQYCKNCATVNTDTNKHNTGSNICTKKKEERVKEAKSLAAITFRYASTYTTWVCLMVVSILGPLCVHLNTKLRSG